RQQFGAGDDDGAIDADKSKMVHRVHNFAPRAPDRLGFCAITGLHVIDLHALPRVVSQFPKHVHVILSSENRAEPVDASVRGAWLLEALTALRRQETVPERHWGRPPVRRRALTRLRRLRSVGVESLATPGSGKALGE